MLRDLINNDLDVVTKRMQLLVGPAFAALFLCAWFGVPALLTSFQLVAFSISAATLSDFRTEKGLWMLATLYFVLWAAISMIWTYGEVRDWMNGAAPPQGILVDGAFATLVMQSHVRYLWKIMRCNRSVSRAQP